MELKDRISNFYRAGIGLVTTLISLAFFVLVGWLVINTTLPISSQHSVFIAVFVLLAIWFGKLSYQLIFQTSDKHKHLFSPLSIIVIFSLIGLSTLLGIISSFLIGDLYNSLFGSLILVLLLPLGHFCWKQAKTP